MAFNNFNGLGMQQFGNTDPFRTQYPNQNRMYNQENPNYNFNQPRPTAPQAVPGKYIHDPNDIKPIDINGDGSPAFFPMIDGSALYVAMWSQDGSRIDKFRFVPDQGQNGNSPKTTEQIIIERLDNLEALIKNQNNRPYKNNNFKKKEVHQNEHDVASNDEQNDQRANG